jgi:hypothetical protein
MITLYITVRWDRKDRELLARLERQFADDPALSSFAEAPRLESRCRSAKYSVQDETS